MLACLTSTRAAEALSVLAPDQRQSDEADSDSVTEVIQVEDKTV